MEVQVTLCGCKPLKCYHQILATNDEIDACSKCQG